MMFPRRLKLFLAAATLLAALPAAAQEQKRPETGCVLNSWHAELDPYDQKHQLRERITTSAGEILAVEFGPLSGEFGKLYLFMLEYGGCERKVFSVGAYAYMTEFARQRGEIGAGETLYHLDLYDPVDRKVLEFRYAPPGYDEMRARALEELR